MKVFLSSTAQDLVAYRQVADNTLLRLCQQVDTMERFGPLPDAPVTECERKASECDLLVCLVAHRYGFVPEAGRGSITRREVEAATHAGKDVLVWIVADEFPWTEVKEQDLLTDPVVRADPIRVQAVVANMEALAAFKSWLQRTFTVDTFTTPDDLATKIAIALASRMPYRAPGAVALLPKHGVIRVVHALQPAPQFHGRDALVTELTAWVSLIWRLQTV